MKLRNARTTKPERPEIEQELSRFWEWIDKTPRTNTVKGMYIGGLNDALVANGVQPPAGPRIQAFKDYPLRAYMAQLIDAATTLYPHVSVHESLRRLGELAIPTFAKSIVGSVTMGVVGHSWELALKCVSRGYEVSLKPGSCTVASIGNGRALLQLRNVWNFGDSYQVGVVQGLMKWCEIKGTVTPKMLSLSDVDLTLEWTIEDSRSKTKSARSRSHAPSAM